MCRSFVAGPLNHTLAVAPSLVDFDFVPWGNAYYVTSDCGGTGSYDLTARQCFNSKCGLGAASPPSDCYSGNIVCQHGKRECDFNLWFTCARKVYKKAELYMPFVTCMEARFDADTDGPNDAAACAHSAGLAISHMATCFHGQSGVQALAENAAATPPHAGVPYVLVEGKPLDDPSTLLKAACDAYQGPKPAACGSTDSEVVVYS